MICPCPERKLHSEIPINNIDKWENRIEKKYLYCSFCGSIDPKSLFNELEKKSILTPTDKDYKIYLETKSGKEKFYLWHLEDEDIYKIINLLEKNKVHLNYPYYFYKTPYILLNKNITPFAFGSIVKTTNKVEYGNEVIFIKPIYERIIDEIRKDINFIYKINYRIWEEIIAASYDKAGFKVTLTPRSCDNGIDVIAEKKGVTAEIYIEQIKAYEHTPIIKADDVRSLLGVLSKHPINASKAIFSTTVNFAPKILDDPSIKSALQDNQLILIDKNKLIERLVNDKFLF